jgi:hypothetical protein
MPFFSVEITYICKNVNFMRLSQDLLVDFITELRAACDKEARSYGKYAIYTKKYKIVQNAINSPAKCFYVSYEEAIRVIYRIMKYGSTGKKGLNAKKYEDLYRTYICILQEDSDIDIKHAIRLACDSPAPRFYISADRAIKMLNKNVRL